MMGETRKIGAAPTAVLHELGQTGARDDESLMGSLGLNRRQLTDAIRRLQIRGYAVADDSGIRLTGSGHEAAARGEIIAGGAHGRVKVVRDTLRERAWRAMRVRRVFTIGELVADAAISEEGQPRDNLARYLSRLARAGYVRELPRRLPGIVAGSNGFKRYMLVRDTGPRAPVWREAVGAVHDPNTGEEVPC